MTEKLAKEMVQGILVMQFSEIKKAGRCKTTGLFVFV